MSETIHFNGGRIRYEPVEEDTRKESCRYPFAAPSIMLDGILDDSLVQFPAFIDSVVVKRGTTVVELRRFNRVEVQYETGFRERIWEGSPSEQLIENTKKQAYESVEHAIFEYDFLRKTIREYKCVLVSESRLPDYDPAFSNGYGSDDYWDRPYSDQDDEDDASK